MPASAYVLALDQGTTSSRALVFDPRGGIVAVAQREFEQMFPQSGWVEHDPNEIWTSQAQVMTEAIERAGIRAADLAAIGITNQRETTILWDRRTGEPIHNAIVWQDRRTASMCESLQRAGHAELFRRKTGLVLDAYFSGTKIKWLLDHVDGAREAATAGHLAFGTVDTWLIWKLTGGAVHATDATNASRTLLYDIHTGQWDTELLELLDVPRTVLPEVRGSSEVYGDVSDDLLDARVPIAGVVGDQQAALFGQMCVEPGMAKNTYGTGCFVLLNTGTEPVISKRNLLTTIAWRIGDEVEYALEGSIFSGGSVIQWLRDGLGLIRQASDSETLAASVPDNGDVYLVPAFVGLGAPHWDPYARGTIVGLTRGTTAGHLARAALESIAYQVADVLEAMAGDSGISVSELRVDGGASVNNLLMQFQADILGVPTVRSATAEVTASGAAYLAGLATGVWASAEQIAEQRVIDRRFEPMMPAADVQQLRRRWSMALERARQWAEPGNAP